jgi:hypothetical protein
MWKVVPPAVAHHRYIAPEDLVDDVFEQLRQTEMLQRYGDNR